MATEIRFAFALNGGVSLAIWIGGVVDEVLRLVDGGKRAAAGEPASADNPYIALCRELDVVPKVDVLAGSSAGGLNAAFLGTAVIHGCSNLHPIKQLWLDYGSFDILLRAPDDAALISVLNGDDNFLPQIETAFRLLGEAGTGFKDVEPPVVVRLTATSLGGRVTTISDGNDSIASVDHRAEFVFRTRDFDFASDDKAIPRLARACRSTASFPGAFEPSSVPLALYESRHVAGLFDGVTAEVIPVIDGAVLVNLPAQTAIDAIIHQPSRERIERVLALVVPDPGEFQNQDDLNPTLNDVLSKSLLGIPRTQSLGDFVRALNDHNAEVRSRRAARDAMFSQFADQDPDAAWQQFLAVGTSLFRSYRATRIATSLDRVRLGLVARLPRGAPAVDQATLDAINPDVVPWIPNELSLGTHEWGWGAAAVRRLAAVLITWINTVAAEADDDLCARLYAIKDRVSKARSNADEISPSAGVFEKLFAEELDRSAPSVAVAFERASQRWPSDESPSAARDMVALNDQLLLLAECLSEFVGEARDLVEATPAGREKSFGALRGLVRLHDGCGGNQAELCRLLLCIEVIEATFSGLEPRPDQEIRLVQFTAKSPVAIDELGRSEPIDKLAGVELAHFGAFLKRSWRANDWMWGRLDSAQRIVRLLDTILGGQLSRDGTLEQHTRAVQAAILREELPTIVTEIEEDARRGARSSTEGRAFCRAVRDMIGVPAGPVDLSHLDDDAVAKLLSMQLVGSENLHMEVGSDLATLTAVNALATAAGVVRAQGPRLLRGPIGVLGVSTLFAWRISKRRQVRRLRIAQSIVVVAMAMIGLVGTLVAAFTAVDLGAFKYVCWALLVLSPFVALFTAPWLLVGLGRRAMGRSAAAPAAPAPR